MDESRETNVQNLAPAPPKTDLHRGIVVKSGAFASEPSRRRTNRSPSRWHRAFFRRSVLRSSSWPTVLCPRAAEFSILGHT